MSPIALSDTTNDMRVAREETFGRVVAVMPFGTEQDLIEKANDTATNGVVRDRA